VPSVSKRPTVAPTFPPSDAPSASPTGSLYYPDWENAEQICVNDGADPEFMKRLQRDQYLYESKEECCETHFWWRVAQCMQNEHNLYYSNGSHCTQKVNLEQWEVKYTPAEWSTSDKFETLEECCNAKFWWDVNACMSQSPQNIVYDFTFQVTQLLEPENCQDADTIANALSVAMDKGLGGGTSNVTSIGDVTLHRDPDTSTPICGGSLAGTDFSGEWDGTRDPSYYNYDPNQVTDISVEVTASCEACTDANSLTNLFNQMVLQFSNYFIDTSDAGLENQIHLWAGNREPWVPELLEVVLVSGSLNQDGTFINPMANPEHTVEAVQVTSSGSLAVPNLNQEVEVVKVTTTGSLSVDNLPTLDSTQATTVADYYENAIAQQLESQGLLTPGTDITVTISNGKVNYSITTYADSTSDATATVNSIESTVSTSAGAITTDVVSDASSDSSLGMASAVGSGHTSGSTTKSTVSEATLEGSLSVGNLAASSFSTDAEKQEAMDYFEDAITKELSEQGLLPVGASVEVTDLIDGSVAYKIYFHDSSSAETNNAMSNIESSMSLSSTLDDIATTAKVDASTANFSGLGTIDITASTVTKTTGLTMTAAEVAAAKEEFEQSILTSLQADLGTDLPPGTTVTVTDIENGVVSYEVTMNTDSSSDATAAVNSVQTSLDSASTLAAITTSVSAGSSSQGATVSGELAVSGFDPSSFSTAQEELAKAHFAASIEDSLGDNLPEGSTVLITGLGPPVSYIISMTTDTVDEANAAITAVQTSLSQSLTQTAITSSVQSSSTLLSGVSVTGENQGDTNVVEKTPLLLSGAAVGGNTKGATTTGTVAKVTSSGQLTTDLSGLSDAEKQEAAGYFESAMTVELQSQGILPEGTSVTATIDDEGNVSFEFSMHMPIGGDNAVVISQIKSALSSASTQATIAGSVASLGAAASSSIGALSSLSVTGFVEGESFGVSFKLWYPDWFSYGSMCKNDGNQPPYMKRLENQGEYLFETQKACCEAWYSYSEECAGSGDPTALKYFPAYTSGGCDRKQAMEFEGYEQVRYDSLQECCEEQFSYNKLVCCESPGMGGCGDEVIIYLPDWENNKCVSRERGSVAHFEEDFTHETLRSCCDSYFSWTRRYGTGEDCYETSS
jgi:hypothetical protein